MQTDKLPTYKDNGKTFIPGLDKAWACREGQAYRIKAGNAEGPSGWEWLLKYNLWVGGPAFSSPQAAREKPSLKDMGILWEDMLVGVDVVHSDTLEEVTGYFVFNGDPFLFMEIF